jgi:hypothetical protein
MRSNLSVRLSFLLIACSLLLPPGAAAEDRQITSGPFSLSVRGGAENNSDALGFDGRVDYLTRMVNLHLLGTVDLLEPNRGMGAIEQQKFGAALALSHTFPALANVYAGTAVVREMGENFGHAYLGGKVKVADFALLSAAYGFGFGDVKQIASKSSLFSAESVDWLEAGVVLVNAQGWKLNAYYTLTDPWDLAVSGLGGEISYPLFWDTTLGVKGNADLDPDTGYWRNWSLFGFVTYAFGDQKGSPIDVALEKNNPLRLPVVLNKNVQQAVAGGLVVSPASATGDGTCGSVPTPNNSATFTVSGGTPPFSWSQPTNGIGWIKGSKNLPSVVWWSCESPEGTGVITVTDSEGRTGSATVTIIYQPSIVRPVR